ncbi:MAG: hypothetical protein B6D56_07470 [Candidatus Omnitrophica bacterium 4484_70.1]|nr:MAG: hypothetical protein B6D56_07470 [Candidatus Omnitrophica bacterium 4484_70.1]
MNNLVYTSEEDNIKVFEIEGDFVYCEDFKKDLFELVVGSEDIYPGIDMWMKKKVIPEIFHRRRKGFIAYFNNAPAGAAILKKDKSTKLCSLRVKDNFRNKGVAHTLLRIISNEIRKYAKLIYFTISEDVWDEIGDFLIRYDLKIRDIYPVKYRKGVKEFIGFTNIKNFIECINREEIIRKLNKTSERKQIVMSVKPEYAFKIIKGEKKIEVRRCFSYKWLNSIVWIYATSPLKSIVGKGIIRNIIEMSPSMAWNEFKKYIGINKEKFYNYVKDKRKIFLVFIDDIENLTPYIPWKNFEAFIDATAPPQSYFALNIK